MQAKFSKLVIINNDFPLNTPPALFFNGRYSPLYYNYHALKILPAAGIAAELIADTARGHILRETRPVFGKGPSSQKGIAEGADTAAS